MATTPDADHGVRLTTAGAVAVVTLDRPSVANALDLDAAAALARAVGAVAADRSVRAVVLRGEGPRFCAGGDVGWFAGRTGDLPAALADITAAIHDAVQGLAQLAVPVVAAVRGSAAGAGLALVLAADLAVAGEGARFTAAFGGIGLTPDTGTSWSLPRAVGHRRAAELLLAGRSLDAATALDWGIVNAVVPDERVDTEAQGWATRLAAGPTRALAATKALLASAGDTLGERLVREREAMIRAGATHDGREGVTAFAERRPPRFEGR